MEISAIKSSKKEFIAFWSILTVLFLIFAAQDLKANSEEGAQSAPPINWLCYDSPFRLSSDNLGDRQIDCLNQAADLIRKDSRALIIIDGHRTSTEPVEISINRANLFRDYLVKRGDIDESRIRVRNFSDTCPINSKEPGRNSRVEIGVVPFGADFDYKKSWRSCEPGSNPAVVTQ